MKLFYIEFILEMLEELKTIIELVVAENEKQALKKVCTKLKINVDELEGYCEYHIHEIDKVDGYKINLERVDE